MRPITQANAKGRRVMIPHPIFPAYECVEFGGAGWEGKIISATAYTALVKHSHAKTIKGVPYEDVRLQISALQAL